MKLRVLALGHQLPGWAEAACAEYQQRLPRDAALECVELKPEARDRGKPADKILEQEAMRLGALLGPQDCPIVLDERGSPWTTRELAAILEGCALEGLRPTFLIGSADGLSPRIKQQARHQFSLSRLTLPHAMARVILFEQLYRAITLIKGHPYHRD
jgi:23S rRNA (pseudouridine1915-N3)-methyltransferase